MQRPAAPRPVGSSAVVDFQNLVLVQSIALRIDHNLGIDRDHLNCGGQPR
jgi:hypothetical protein